MSKERSTVTEEAVLVTASDLPLQYGNLSKMLRFFGVPQRVVALFELLEFASAPPERFSQSRLVLSSGVFVRLTAELRSNPDGARWWRDSVHSVFVYCDGGLASLHELRRSIEGDGRRLTVATDRANGDWVMTRDMPEFCGPLSGIRTPPGESAMEVYLIGDAAEADTVGVISNQRGAVFVKIDYETVPVFLSTSGEILDIDSDLQARSFDVRRHFLSTVPFVLYVKWAFPESCWKAPAIDACVVIDDPPLKPRYGFLEYRALLKLMVNHNFSTSIAFIPWNWRRSAPEVVRLFKDNPERFSLSVHGCDHTGGEFGTADTGLLTWKARRAVERMSRHEAQTGLRYDPIMVFPQGVFSRAAVDVLKHSNFIAAVNSEIVSTDPHPEPLKIRDVWNGAVRNYGSVPIFTRRYPYEGIENFAFDIVLGKPCIIVIHHDFCRNEYAALVDFVKSINALNVPISWRGLGEVVRWSYRQRETSQGLVEVEMYATEIRIANLSAQPKRFSIVKHEPDPSAIKEIHVGSENVKWQECGDEIHFGVQLDSGEKTRVRIEFKDDSPEGDRKESAGYKVKTMLRRHLSEVRDNYVTTSNALGRVARLHKGIRERFN